MGGFQRGVTKGVWKSRTGKRPPAVFLGGNGGNGGGSSKTVTAFGVTDADTIAILHHLDTRTMDLMSFTDSNGYIDAFGWSKGLSLGLAQAGHAQFAGQLSGYYGTGGRGDNTHVVALSTSSGGTWETADAVSEPNGFTVFSMHQLARCTAGVSSQNSDGQAVLDSTLGAYSSANLIQPSDHVLSEQWYERYASGAGEMRHSSKNQVPVGVGGASTLLDSAAMTGPSDIVSHVRDIAASGGNTILYSSPGFYASGWNQQLTGKCGPVAHRWHKYGQTAGWSHSLIYQGGGTTQKDICTSVASADAGRIASYQWYVGRLIAAQQALGQTPCIVVDLTHGVNDAGSATLSVDGVNTNDTKLGYKANTLFIMDWLRDHFPGTASWLHFLLTPGFCMDQADTGKDVGHQFILEGATELALAEPRTSLYDFRAIFPYADMAANTRWRDGGTDKNHLDVAAGYVPMSLKKWQDLTGAQDMAM